jgi:Fur family peroxide stress response transcriptional regulator
MAARENYSRKRVAILEALKSTKVHPTAEWVYEKLKPEYSDLSLGTVYRNIKKFCAEDKVRSVGVINGQEHFDADMSPHSHFVCEKCNSVSDIYEVFLQSVDIDALDKKYGVRIENEEVIFNGICQNCLKHEA